MLDKYTREHKVDSSRDSNTEYFTNFKYQVCYMPSMNT